MTTKPIETKSSAREMFEPSIIKYRKLKIAISATAWCAISAAAHKLHPVVGAATTAGGLTSTLLACYKKSGPIASNAAGIVTGIAAFFVIATGVIFARHIHPSWATPTHQQERRVTAIIPPTLRL